MKPIVQPLQWYVDRLANNNHFSLARYGDGELICMFGGGQPMNSNGCYYTPELRRDLCESMRHDTFNNKTFIYGLQRVLPSDVERVEETWPLINWHDSEVFGDALVEGKLWPLIKQLQQMNLVLIGNKRLIKMYPLLKYKHIVLVPETNAHVKKLDVYRNLLDYQSMHQNETLVYLFSCGMAANVFVSDLYPILRNSFLLDVGHIWDPFIDAPITRCNTDGMTKEQIDRNLKP